MDPNDDLNGYGIAIFEKHKDKKIGYPMFKIFDRNSTFDLKVALVGGPLNKDRRESLQELIKDGYMVMAIQSFRSYPVFN